MKAALLLAIAQISSGFFWNRDDGNSQYNVNQFATPAECMNEGFDFTGYIDRQAQIYYRLDEQDKFGVKLNYNSKIGVSVDTNLFDPSISKTFLGKGHSWTVIGSNKGQRCLDQTQFDPNSYDASGCLPFSNVIQKFQHLEHCFSAFELNPDGSWMQGGTKQHFDLFELSNSERIVTRLAVLAERNFNDNEWSREQLKNIFNQTQLDNGAIEHVNHCIQYATLDRKQLKCYSVVMGAPGYSGMTITDHAPKGGHEIQKNGAASKVCDVPPSCGRLALEKLSQFQNGRGTDLSNIVDGFRKHRLITKASSWININGDLKNVACNLAHQELGPALCWQYSDCLPEMMKLVCQEHGSCCPNQIIRDSCRGDIRSSDCRICEKPKRKPWYKFW